uniref:Uncharacterized protein n=1 Tax=Palpitomonas bilix TaxID=652834 RepID=A0A7S3LRU9_9EUKA|mmetsp:Transcript_43614/g.113622  ORF Transcript_43614/g.113622 Transcript_43614/m.113622 type:complete len:753 (+) Transcript_43614:334-2592(+)
MSSLNIGLSPIKEEKEGDAAKFIRSQTITSNHEIRNTQIQARILERVSYQNEESTVTEMVDVETAPLPRHDFKSNKDLLTRTEKKIQDIRDRLSGKKARASKILQRGLRVRRTLEGEAGLRPSNEDVMARRVGEAASHYLVDREGSVGNSTGAGGTAAGVMTAMSEEAERERKLPFRWAQCALDEVALPRPAWLAFEEKVNGYVKEILDFEDMRDQDKEIAMRVLGGRFMRMHLFDEGWDPQLAAPPLMKEKEVREKEKKQLQEISRKLISKLRAEHFFESPAWTLLREEIDDIVDDYMQVAMSNHAKQLSEKEKFAHLQHGEVLVRQSGEHFEGALHGGGGRGGGRDEVEDGSETARESTESDQVVPTTDERLLAYQKVQKSESHELKEAFPFLLRTGLECSPPTDDQIEVSLLAVAEGADQARAMEDPFRTHMITTVPEEASPVLLETYAEGLCEIWEREPRLVAQSISLLRGFVLPHAIRPALWKYRLMEDGLEEEITNRVKKKALETGVPNPDISPVANLIQRMVNEFFAKGGYFAAHNTHDHRRRVSNVLNRFFLLSGQHAPHLVPMAHLLASVYPYERRATLVGMMSGLAQPEMRGIAHYPFPVGPRDIERDCLHGAKLLRLVDTKLCDKIDRWSKFPYGHSDDDSVSALAGLLRYWMGSVFVEPLQEESLYFVWDQFFLSGRPAIMACLAAIVCCQSVRNMIDKAESWPSEPVLVTSTRHVRPDELRQQYLRVSKAAKEANMEWD